LRSLGFLFREFIDGLSQNRLVHFAYGTQVMVSLLVLGIFFVLLTGSAIFWARLGSRLEIHAFLDDTLTQDMITEVEAQLGGIEHVTDVTFRSKDEALQHFNESNPNMKLDGFTKDNPLPASFIVRVDRPGNIEAVAEVCSNVVGVFDVSYAKQLLDRYIKVMVFLMAVSIATIAVLIVFVYTSISNIIRVSTDARSNEIRIMQLVGATWWFIRWPFLFEGVFIGMIGSVTALLVVWGLLAALAGAMQASDLPLQLPWINITEWQLFAWLGVVLIGLGLIVGFLGSLQAVNTYLHREVEVSLDAQRIKQLTRSRL
jgi:cell division transport system permease protein